jgi:hypothetical protein
MIRNLVAIGVVAVLWAPEIVASEKEPQLTNDDVTAMVRAGLAPAVVVAKIDRSACRFDSSVQALQALRVARVPDDVVVAMIRAAVAAPTAPDDEVVRRCVVQFGEYVAESVARNAEYVVRTEDATLLWKIAECVPVRAPRPDDVLNVVAVSIRDESGSVLAQVGPAIRDMPARPPAQVGHLETETASGEPVTLFHAPVTRSPRSDGAVIGGVEVAIGRLEGPTGR